MKKEAVLKRTQMTQKTQINAKNNMLFFSNHSFLIN